MPNRNRTSRTSPVLPGAEAITYDAQGRLAQRGGTVYSFDDGGMLSARGADRFTFGALRPLEQAVIAGTTIDYAFDALGRRTARSVDGQTEQFLYGDLENPWLLTAWRAADGQLNHYHHDPMGRLIAVQRGTERFYVATDVAGSPRVVTDAVGTVLKRLDYDAHGELIFDSDPLLRFPWDMPAA